MTLLENRSQINQTLIEIRLDSAQSACTFASVPVESISRFCNQIQIHDLILQAHPHFQYPMLRTSYFAKSAKDPGAVSIARFPPKWYTGARYLPLAPAPDMLKIKDWDEYRRRYHEEVLSVLDPDKVLRDLGVDKSGNDIIMLCFEKDRAHCHRGLVAAWFYETRGITVPELGTDATTHLPF